MVAPGNQIVEIFDRHARWYDAQLLLERRALRLAARIAEPLGGARVVDVGAGTGALAAAVVARPGRVAALTLVDGSPAMLARARRRLRASEPSPRIVVADARALPLADASADLVTMGYLLHLLGDRDRRSALAEARRVLRRGGRLVAVVHGSPPGRAGRAYRALWRAVGRATPGEAVGGPMTGLAASLREGGFTVDVVRRLPGIYWSEVVRAVV
jgi:ubiquinone/menaquinone biosynthesis C-methylase UbiE